MKAGRRSSVRMCVARVCGGRRRPARRGERWGGVPISVHHLLRFLSLDRGRGQSGDLLMVC